MEGTKIRLFKQTTPDGKTYLVGSMSKVSRLIVIENDRKKDAKDPDSYAYIVPNRGGGRGIDIGRIAVPRKKTERSGG